MGEDHRNDRSEAVDGKYISVPHTVLDSVAFIGARYTAKAFYVEMMRQHNGANNGHLPINLFLVEKSRLGFSEA